MTDLMYLARETFTADYYGGRVEVRGGITRMASEHELVARYPAAFTPIEIGPGQPRCRNLTNDTRGGLIGGLRFVDQSTSSRSWEPPARSTPAASESSSVELVEFPVSSPIVRLTPAARSQLETHTWRFSDGRETGGGLIALGGSDLTITGVTTPSDHDERSAYSFTHDFEREQSFLAAGERIAGSFHSHPISADGRPSVQDLTSWANLREDHGAERFVGVIVTPNLDVDLVVGRAMEWSDPQIHACVVRDVGGRVVAERGQIEEKWGWE